jgi:hypothetical protein
MAIRLKNLDLSTEGMKSYSQVSLGDVTATSRRIIFTAPVPCVVNYVDIYSGEACPPAGTTASTTAFAVLIQRADNSAALITQRATSATALTSDSILADTRYRLVPSANNSLSTGTPIEMLVSAQGSGNLSGTLCVVTYTPLLHRESR